MAVFFFFFFLGNGSLNHWTTREVADTGELFIDQLWCVLLLLLLSRFSRVQLFMTPRRQPTRLARPWDSPGKNTGVGCHFLLQCMKVGSMSDIAESCPTLNDPMDCSLPGSSVLGIFQVRVLEWVAIAFSRCVLGEGNPDSFF